MGIEVEDKNQQGASSEYFLVFDCLDEDVDATVLEILRFVGLENDLEKLPEALSIGMRRRLELARALVGWPSIMLFDEPTSGLDPINARMILDLIIRARDIHHISSLLVRKELHQITYITNHHAAQLEDETVIIEKGAPAKVPEINGMLLDKGRLVFLGTDAAFQSSTLPAAGDFKDCRSRVHQASTDEKDPWKNVARWKHL
jgi:phospholipid/cholesterol/gamma-HCH transport system ATP-binding protein